MGNSYREAKDGELTYGEHKKAREYDGTGNPAEAVAKQMGRPSVPHYQQGSIEPIDYINSHKLNFNLGNVIKYITRSPHKGTRRLDLQKARDYINFELESFTGA